MTVALRSWWLRFADIPIGPNDHISWQKRASQNRRWKVQAWAEALVQEIPPCERIRVSVVFRRRAVGLADEDNDAARMKPLIDGIVSAKVITDDRREFIEWGSISEQRGARGMDVLIEELSR